MEVMNMHATLSIALISGVLAGSAALAEEAKGQEKAAKPSPAPSPALRLPVGMARANQPQEVAALYNEANQKRIAAAQEQVAQEEKLTAAEEYHLKLVAYREQLVEEQRQRKIKEMELQLEREARLRAEQEAIAAKREERRRSIYLQHHSVHAIQRRLNDEYYREQRLRQIIREEQGHSPCPPDPCPAPAPVSEPVSSDEGEDSSGDVLP